MLQPWLDTMLVVLSSLRIRMKLKMLYEVTTIPKVKMLFNIRNILLSKNYRVGLLVVHYWPFGKKHPLHYIVYRLYVYKS